MNNTSIEQKPPLILIVDDNDMIRLTMGQAMEQVGYRVESAANGEKGLAAYIQLSPDIVLLDAMMPVMDGFTCCAKIQSLPEEHHAPVLMITGLDDRKSVNRAFEAGAADYVTKPIHWAVLIQRVKRLIQQFQLYRQLQEANQTLEMRVGERTVQLEQTIERLEVEIRERQRAEAALKLADADVRQALEREKELSELKSNLITTVSHEFRTPLSVITTSAELLELKHLQWNEEKLSRCFGKIHTSVRRMLQVLEDTLTLNKIEAGEYEFEPTPLNLTHFCRYLVAQWQLKTSSPHVITFVSQGEPTISPCLDADLLNLILTHLISNAIRYSPKGGNIVLELIYEQSSARINIQDSGIGIPEADITQIFDKFYRASNANNIPGTPGIGLGLTIVKKAVDLLEGTISAKSEVGAGTIFTISLPLCSNV